MRSSLFRPSIKELDRVTYNVDPAVRKAFQSWELLISRWEWQDQTITLQLLLDMVQALKTLIDATNEPRQENEKASVGGL